MTRVLTDLFGRLHMLRLLNLPIAVTLGSTVLFCGGHPGL